MKIILKPDASNRILLPREVRQAAGIRRGERLVVSATPGRIVLEMEPDPTGQIIKRGKLKVWTGTVPATPIEQVIEAMRRGQLAPSEKAT
jgi:bifunctional DNA-binding transcriptional regulator/antitoxin component of YhaV-PrlF toxin-antitoxin module